MGVGEGWRWNRGRWSKKLLHIISKNQIPCCGGSGCHGRDHRDLMDERDQKSISRHRDYENYYRESVTL